MSELKPELELEFDDFLDAQGHVRRFRWSLYAGERFLDAVELRKDGSHGLRFILPVLDGRAPYGELRVLIREYLSQRDLVRDQGGELQDLHRVIRAQIASTGVGCEVPVLLVDDLEVTWQELGQLLMTYEGFKVRIEITDGEWEKWMGTKRG